MPDRYSYIEIGERDYDNPLPYDKIDKADYEVWNDYIDYEETISKSIARMEQSEQLMLIEENARWIKNRRDEVTVDLNYNNYKTDLENRIEESKKFEALDEYDNMLSYQSLPYEIELMKQDTTLTEKRKRWHKVLSNDIYVEEAVYVLEDLKLRNIRRGKVANIKN